MMRHCLGHPEADEPTLLGNRGSAAYEEGSEGTVAWPS